MAIDISSYTQKRDTGNIASLFFLVAIIIVTVLSYGLNYLIVADNASKKSEIATLTSSIEELKKDKKVQIYELVEKNAAVLEKLSKHSNIVSFIAHVQDIAIRYGVTFSGFQYSGGNISMEAYVSSGERGLAFVKLGEFISTYRNEEKRLFNLGFIRNFIGHDTIKFPIQFSIK